MSREKEDDNQPALSEMVPLLGTLERDEENHIDLDDAATEEKLKKRRLKETAWERSKTETTSRPLPPPIGSD
jgi:hypothetical protein